MLFYDYYQQVPNTNKLLILKAASKFLGEDPIFLTQLKTINITNEQILKIERIAILMSQNKDYTNELEYKFIYNLKIKINNKVFVPQYDTEAMIDFFKTKKKNLIGVEIGSGSGFISIALSKYFNHKMTSIDVSNEAIALSKTNNKLNETSVNFLKKDFRKYKFDFKNLDFIISNPPYIWKKDPKIEPWVRNNQPSKALYSRKKGLYHLIKIINLSKRMKKNSFIILEHSIDQNLKLQKYLIKKDKNFTFLQDINNYKRFLIIIV